MKPKNLVGFIFFIVALGLTLPSGAGAVVVGQLTGAEGQVELRKGGEAFTSIAMKVLDGVEPGDVVLTRALSRAHITFMDKTVLILGQESQVLIEEYLYDAGRRKRQAVLKIFRGLVQSLVKPITEAEESYFSLKTLTAVCAIRGTSTYVEIGLAGTEIYNESGRVRVSSNLPLIWGYTDLGEMECCGVALGCPPTPSMPFTQGDLAKLRERWFPTQKEDAGGARQLVLSILKSLSDRFLFVNRLLPRPEK